MKCQVFLVGQIFTSYISTRACDLKAGCCIKGSVGWGASLGCFFDPGWATQCTDPNTRYSQCGRGTYARIAWISKDDINHRICYTLDYPHSTQWAWVSNLTNNSTCLRTTCYTSCQGTSPIDLGTGCYLNYIGIQ